mgnify:CR=1 FL=1
MSLRPLLGLVVFLALVGFAWLGLAVLTGWPALAVVLVALLAAALLPELLS